MTDPQQQNDLLAEAAEEFRQWFRDNYPGPNTIIARPDWHAPKVFRAATHRLAARVRALEEDGKLLDRLRPVLFNCVTIVDVCDAEAGPEGRWSTDACLDAVEIVRAIAKGIDEEKLRGNAVAVAIQQSGPLPASPDAARQEPTNG